ncbi:MAG: LytTR family transcriptional regulator [Eggerthellaceae bacterium]|nr:LytTR family transcriptional regulator [Eggerthellaceae bacterium]
MDLKLTQIGTEEPELVDIRYRQMTEQVHEIASFVRLTQEGIAVSEDGKLRRIPIAELYYAEAVDNRVFAYTASDVFEVHMRLYELEQVLNSHRFLRVSKQVLVNLMKVESIRPALNGRFIVHLRNGEDVIVSRKYVPDLKRALQ